MNAQQLALKKLNGIDNRGGSKHHSLGGDIGSFGAMSCEHNDNPSETNNSGSRVSTEVTSDGFIEVTGKKKKRKTYERTNSAKNCERNNKAGSGDALEGINIFFKSNNPQNC